eukprot:m.176623 g.176623  ORF g.176623 m.176623 type:complete len:480 (-) comp14208_c0_seq1:271-1710(-)
MMCGGRRRGTRDAPKLVGSSVRKFEALLHACRTGAPVGEIARLCHTVNPNAVKVVKDDASPPMYFARAPSWNQVDADPTPWAQYLTPLREAISGGHLHIVKHLVEVHRINLSVGRPDSGSLPHNYAASQGHLEIVRYLVTCGRGLCVTHGSSTAWKERHNDPATDSFVLRSACESGNVDLVRFVLMEGCDANTPDPINGGTPLECACASGDLEIVKLVHRHGANINVARTCDCCRDWTPLHEATAAGAPDVIDYLLRAGSTQLNTQCTGKDRITPLDLAFEADHVDCAKILFAHGAVLHWNPTQHELRQQFTRYARSFGVNGWTNLQLCADFRMAGLAQWFLNQGLADPASCAVGTPSPRELVAQPSRFDDEEAPSQAVQQIFRRAELPWRISTHALFGPGFRRTVRTLLLVQQAHKRCPVLGVTLPLEMWLNIAAMMRRSDHDAIAPVSTISREIDLSEDALRIVFANIGYALAGAAE